jgi:hypothetical protein
MKTYWWRFALGLAMLAAGCGKSDSGPTADGKGAESKAVGGAPTSGQVSGGQATTGQAAGAAQVDSTPADRYTHELVTGIASGDVGRLWTALPPKYQADVKSVLAEAAANLDAEVYDKVFAVAGKMAQVLKTKKDLVLNCEPVAKMAPPGTKEFAGLFWTPAVTALETVVYSDIKTLEGLKQTDPGQFLSTTGGKLFQIAKSSFPDAEERIRKVKESKVAIFKQDGDNATLAIEVQGDSPDKLEVTRVEGKWLPSFIVRGWEQQMSGLRSDLGSLKLTPDVKSMLLGALQSADASLDKMLATTDQKAFDMELGRLLNALPLMPVPSEVGGPPVGSPAAGAPTLTGSLPGGNVTPGVPARSPYNPGPTPGVPSDAPAGLPAFPPGVTPGSGAPLTPPGLTPPGLAPPQ